jgi:hypothetical protein
MTRTWIRDQCPVQKIIGLDTIVRRLSGEGHRGVITVKYDEAPCVRSQQTLSFGQDCSRIGYVADERVHDDNVEAALGQTQVVRVADAKCNPIPDAHLCCKSPSRLYKVGADVNRGDRQADLPALGDSARCYTGTAA